jgi:hypothetical protein
MAPFSKAAHTGDDDLLREWVRYDRETGDLLWRKQYGRRAVGTPVGTPHSKGYLMFRLRGQAYFNHRVAFFLEAGRWPATVDHVNGDKRDNRWANLREATVGQNLRNQTSTTSKSGFRGVTFDRASKRVKRWIAKIKHEGRVRQIGYFHTAEEAHAAYRAESLRLHGEFSPFARGG